MSVEVHQKVLQAGDDGHGRLVLLTSSPGKGSARSSAGSRWSATC